MARLGSAGLVEFRCPSISPPSAASRISRTSPSATRKPRHLQGELNAILTFVEALEAVDVTGVEPMTSVMPMKLPMREDVVTDGEIEPQVLANAPLAEDGFFLVPKVVE